MVLVERSNQGETPLQGAIREVKEETGADISEENMYCLGTLKLPYNCYKEQRDGAELWFYSATIDKSEVSQQIGETERLFWCKAVDILTSLPMCKDLAGDGDIPFFVNMAMLHYGWNLLSLEDDDPEDSSIRKSPVKGGSADEV